MSGRHGRIEDRIITELARKRVLIATAESCTGGLIASRITDVPGASAVFWGSWCVYDNSAKLQLGVTTDTLREHGAVSPETALRLAAAGLSAMLDGLSKAPADQVSLQLPASRHLCLATTGIAGPSGGSAARPVGLCYIGLAIEGAEARSRKIQAPPELTRAENKGLFSEKALELLHEYLEEI